MILCFNLGGHWLLSREVSASRQGVIDRRVEEDRQEKRREAEARRQIELEKAKAESLKEQTRAIREERRRLAQLPPEQRRSVLAATSTPKPEPVAPVATTTPVLEAAVEPATPAAPMTPEQVAEKWWWYLTALAFAECFASMLAGAVLLSIWEWDRNHDGIPDHLQAQSGTAWPRSLDVGK